MVKTIKIRTTTFHGANAQAHLCGTYENLKHKNPQNNNNRIMGTK